MTTWIVYGEGGMLMGEIGGVNGYAVPNKSEAERAARDVFGPSVQCVVGKLPEPKRGRRRSARAKAERQTEKGPAPAAPDEEE
jgi:hypothetical protein